MLYNPQHIYWRRPISPEGDRSDYFGVSPELHREMQSAFEPADLDREKVTFRDGQARADAETYRLQRRIVDYVQRHPDPDVMAVEESVIEVLHRLLMATYAERPAAAFTRTQHLELVDNARAYLAAHYASKQTLVDVARALDCSVFHLCRLFRRHTRMTLHEYRQQLRVRHALEPVTSGRNDLLEVALELGYSGHSHFTAAFRQAFGAPPSIVRAEPLTLSQGRDSRSTAHLRHNAH